MADSRSDRLLVVADRLYRLLLMAYPPRFRREYGAAMAQVFRDCCREAYQRRGLPGILRVWLIALGDTASTALAERISQLLQRRSIDMAETSAARWRLRDEWIAERFKALLPQIADDNEPDYKGKVDAARDEEAEQEVNLADEPPIIQIAHTILALAIRDDASAIHVEPGADSVDVHFRLDGVMRQVMQLPKRVQRKLVARYKYMAGMEFEERDLPQDGRIAVSHRGADHVYRVHSQPMANGESVLMNREGANP